MLSKEDIEQSLKRALNHCTVDGDTIRALTELYNSLPSGEATASQLTTRDELQDLADELNKAEPIDWYNDSQEKYSIKFNFTNKELWTDLSYNLKGLDIYSTDNCFLEKAKKRIGEDRLITLFEKEM